ncbi:MAG: tRNA (N6-threonylcarbamoyladenosine(37)-N6)-methyltransferase TrmO [Bacteroidales bacterium]|nr:tRNA (N6-threonylcarbamoyladenosine(37)-N6)-methyltransferase TrmO [Bacteroidales bacterium]
MKPIIINPIGVIHTPYKEINNMPIQPASADGIKGYIELFPEYVEGIKDLDGFSHIILLYHFHKVHRYELIVRPFMDITERGVYATRAPRRPNAIGLSTVKLTGIENNIILIEQVDILDGSPLIDIKPFIQRFDNRMKTKSGWFEKRKKLKSHQLISDERFEH